MTFKAATLSKQYQTQNPDTLVTDLMHKYSNALPTQYGHEIDLSFLNVWEQAIVIAVKYWHYSSDSTVIVNGYKRIK